MRRAAKRKDRKDYAGASNQLQAAVQLLSGLPTPDDQQLRALCYLRLAETSLYGEARATHPPLGKQTASKCLALCDKAEAELAPLLAAPGSPLIEWRKWHGDPPMGLIELYRGAALHFSSRATDDQRKQAIEHYQRVVGLLRKLSEHGMAAHELLSDALGTESLVQELDLPPPPAEFQAFLDSLSSAMVKVELERQKDNDH